MDILGRGESKGGFSEEKGGGNAGEIFKGGPGRRSFNQDIIK